MQQNLYKHSIIIRSMKDHTSSTITNNYIEIQKRLDMPLFARGHGFGYSGHPQVQLGLHVVPVLPVPLFPHLALITVRHSFDSLLFIFFLNLYFKKTTINQVRLIKEQAPSALS